jgi:hypothetical protein
VVKFITWTSITAANIFFFSYYSQNKNSILSEFLQLNSLFKSNCLIDLKITNQVSIVQNNFLYSRPTKTAVSDFV